MKKWTPRVSNKIDILAILLAATFIIAGSIVSINRFWQYEVFYYDFGIFDSAIWKVSRFQAPVIDHLVISGKWIFADHFNPSIFLLSPIYWITQESEILLIIQSFTVGLSGLVIYAITKKLTNSQISSLAILASYFLFVGLQNAVITDFHEVTIATLFLALSFWAFLNKKIFLYFLFLIITLGFKESMFAVGIGLAIAIFIIDRNAKKIALVTFLISLIWGVLAIKFIIPYFLQADYQYQPDFSLNPIKIVFAFFDNEQKIRTLLYSFLSFGFLPIPAFPFFPLIFQDFFTRFYQFWPVRWGLGFHYSAILSVVFAFSSAYTLSLIKNEKLLRVLSVYLVIISLFLFRFVLHGPFLLALNKDFYRHTKDFEFLNDVVEKVPRDASIMTQNNLASHFAHQTVYLIRNDYEKYSSDYILIDNRIGQSPSNYFGSDLELVLEKLVLDENYDMVYKKGGQYLFKNRE